MIKKIKLDNIFVILALIISILSLTISIRYEKYDVEISNVNKTLGMLNGLTSYKEEVKNTFILNSNELLTSIENVNFDDKEENILRKNLLLKCIHLIANSSDELFFTRHGISQEYNTLYRLLTMEEVFGFSGILFRDSLSSLNESEINMMISFDSKIEMVELEIALDNLISAVDSQIKELEQRLEIDFKDMVENRVVDSNLAKQYYSNNEHQKGYTFIQTEFWEKSNIPKMGFTESLLLTAFDFKFGSKKIDKLFSETMNKNQNN